MLRSPFLRAVLLVSIVAIILFPLYAIFVQYPAFTKLLTETKNKEAEHIAIVFTSLLDVGTEALTEEAIPPGFLSQILPLLKDSHIIKMKIFSPSGTIVYSTDPGEVGRINEEDYFQHIIESGDRKSQQIAKDTRSLERQIMPVDVIETYVPIVKNNRMVGVFEIYYDISAEKQQLMDLTNRSTGTLFLLAVLLLAAVLATVIKAAGMLKERRRIEASLAESETRYRTLFENAADAIFIIDTEGDQAGRIVEANKAVALMHGYTHEELLAMKITDLDAPDSARESPELVRRILNGEWVKSELSHRKKDGTLFPVEVSAGLLEVSGHRYILAFDRDISLRRQVERGREKLIKELQEAMENIKTLRGMLPICASCKKIRDDKGYWSRIETYFESHSEVEFTHGICPDCATRLYPEYMKDYKDDDE